MKKFLLSTVALATMTAGAIAADLPVRTMAPPPYVAVPVFTWTGGYVGVNLGGAWRGNSSDDFGFGNRYTTGAGFPVDAGGGALLGLGLSRDNNDVRVLGGVQAGYNWQFAPGGGFVWGVEGDIQWIGKNNDRNGFFGFGGDAGFATASPNPQIALPRIAAPGNVAFFGNEGLLGGSGGGDNWFATARLRAGYAVDRALFYVTGGLAFKDSKSNDDGFGVARNFGGTAVGVALAAPTFFVPGSPLTVAGTNVFIASDDNNNIGWALGLGAEYAFTNSLSAKIEYLHVEFERNKARFGGAQVVGVTNTGAAILNNGNFGGARENSIDLVRVGLNWRFSGW